MEDHWLLSQRGQRAHRPSRGQPCFPRSSHEEEAPSSALHAPAPAAVTDLHEPGLLPPRPHPWAQCCSFLCSLLQKRWAVAGLACPHPPVLCSASFLRPGRMTATHVTLKSKASGRVRGTWLILKTTAGKTVTGRSLFHNWNRCAQQEETTVKKNQSEASQGPSWQAASLADNPTSAPDKATSPF